MQVFSSLLFLLTCLNMVTAVTGCHSDRDKDDRPRQNCTAGGFNNIPSGLEPTTEVLLLPINQLSSLSWSDYRMFPKIYEIDLTSNQIHALSDISEGGLKTLRVLRLGSNGLEVLADGCFSPFPFLAELYLPHNSLVSLPDDVFRDLNKLEILDLSSNRIIVLPPKIIYPLEVIETLYLENNKIQAIPDDWFSVQDMGIPYLFLSANPWRCSCSLGYLHDYLLEFESSVYVRNGTVVNSRPKSVVCHSPGRLEGRPVIDLKAEDLCPPIITTAPTSLTAPPTTAAPTTTTAPTTAAPTTTTTDPTTTAAPTTTTTAPTTAAPTTTTTDPTTTTTDPTTTAAPTTTTTDLTTTNAPTTTTAPTTTAAITTASTTPPAPTMLLQWVSSTEYPVAAIGSSSGIATSTPTPMPNTSVATAAVATAAVPTEVGGFQPGARRGGGGGGVRAYCAWLFAGCVLLCALSLACTALSTAWLVLWYRRAHGAPLRDAPREKRGGGGRRLESLRMMSCRKGRRVEEERGGGGGGGGTALYRSVLFVSRGVEPTQGEREGEGARGGEKAGQGGVRERAGERDREEWQGGAGETAGESTLIVLRPAGLGGVGRRDEVERKGRGGGGEEESVSREESFRLFSRQEEIACRLAGAGGGALGARYSVVLREEREGGEGAARDWVVGGWAVTPGTGAVRSSWGEWLTRYLPNMPWGAAVPSEGAPAE
uniref:LRRCT domain-containing protein n=1 Tax=Gadus morhua TaxID=8049 RepID=A0A8C5CL01_GADMO